MLTGKYTVYYTSSMNTQRTPNICRSCRKPLTTMSRKHYYHRACREVKDVLSRATANVWRRTSRICVTCGGSYDPRAANQRYCAPRCWPSTPYKVGSQRGLSQTFKIDGMTCAEFAYQVLMERRGMKVTYIGRNGTRFHLSRSPYRPDFHLRGTKTYIEVGGERRAFHANKHKYAEFRERYPDLTLLIVKPDGSPMEVSA